MTATQPYRPLPPSFHHFVRPSQGHSDSKRPSVIPSEAEESKPVVGSRGAIHATRPCIEARCSAKAWLQDKVLRFLTTFGMTSNRVAIRTLLFE